MLWSVAVELPPADFPAAVFHVGVPCEFRRVLTIDIDSSSVTMNRLPTKAWFAIACASSLLAVLVAALAGMSGEMRTLQLSLFVGSATLLAASGFAAWCVTRSALGHRPAQRYLESLARMDDAELRAMSMTRDVAGLGGENSWHGVFQQVRSRLLEQSERVEALGMNRAALEVRAKKSASDHERIASILSGFNEPVLAIDQYNEVVLANPSAESLFDFELEGTEDRMLRDLVRCEELIDLLQDTRRHTSRERSREMQLASGEDDSRWYSVTARSLAEANGDPTAVDPEQENGAVIVFRDISSQKDLQKRNAEFVASVSHEMKTPLSGIKAYVELLADGDAEDEESREEFLDVINSQADRLQRLIENLLNIARIEAGVVDVSKKAQSLNDLLEEAFSVVQPAAEMKNIRLTRELSSMYLGVLVDRDMMSQAAINLLSNAIKYTPEGREVVLRSRLVDNEVEFEVEDQGVGLSDEDQSRVFEKFYRVKKDKKMAAGTGLGLPLAKHIVEDVHRGALSVRSELGVGSTFVIRLSNAGQMS